MNDTVERPRVYGPTSIRGQTVLITGASSGLGRYFSKLVARQGARVVVAARRREQLNALTDELRNEGHEAFAVTIDVTNVGSVRRGVAEAIEQVGKLTGLINNSGVAETVALLSQDEVSWDRILDTNLKGAWAVAAEVARHMRTQGGGTIVNVASILGLRQAGLVSAYATSKAALLQLTKQMALELARDGIRVNALAPGYFETELNREFFRTRAGLAMVQRIPQRRLGRLEDLDGPLLLLLSQASAYMTGSVLVVDGGHVVSTL
jgi:NAD(P)-dependent dehydrogenase (short-subunit alcohol dehydrogenase family)